MFLSKIFTTDLPTSISCFTFQKIIDVNIAYANYTFTVLSFRCEDSDGYISLLLCDLLSECQIKNEL